MTFCMQLHLSLAIIVPYNNLVAIPFFGIGQFAQK